MSLENTRRAFISGIAATGTSLMAGGKLFDQDASPESHEHEHEHDQDHEHSEGGDAFLLVADTEAKTLTIYNAGNYSTIETIENVVVNSHAGTIPLPDGSVLLVDDEGQRLLHIEVHGDHLHVHEAAVPGAVAHIAVESDHAHYCVVGTTSEDEFQLHIVSLESFEVQSIQLADAAEVGLMLTHDYVFHRNSSLNQLEAYSLSDLLDGTTEILSYVDIGTLGHGEAVNEETGELFMLTDDGVDIAYFEDGELTYGKTLAWPQPDSAARGFFCRLINEGDYLLTYASDRSAPETKWTTWTNQAVIYDITEDTPIVTDLPNGYTFRYALAETVATFVVQTGEGDVLVTIDTDAESESFGTVIATTDLESQSDAAFEGDAFYEVGAYRAQAILPDASAVFISRAGDGIIEVLDPIHGESIGSIEHSSGLSGGGTLAVFGSAVPFTDTIGR